MEYNHIENEVQAAQPKKKRIRDQRGRKQIRKPRIDNRDRSGRKQIRGPRKSKTQSNNNCSSSNAFTELKSNDVDNAMINEVNVVQGCSTAISGNVWFIKKNIWINHF